MGKLVQRRYLVELNPERLRVLRSYKRVLKKIQATNPATGEVVTLHHVVKVYPGLFDMDVQLRDLVPAPAQQA